MKKILIVYLVSLTQAVFAGFAGGMDGGGGGTLPTFLVSVYEVEDIVFESKHKLLYLFNAYEKKLKYRTTDGFVDSLQEKLFLGHRKVQEVLKDLRVEVRRDKPCLNAQGTEVDGSIFALKPNTICISAWKISQKLDRAMAEREILALLAHEVSHFMGADEAEATELQKDVAWIILHYPQETEIDAYKIRSEVSDSLNLLRGTIDELEKNDFDKALGFLSKMRRITGISISSIFSLFTPREEDYQDLLRLKLIWAENYLRTIVSTHDQAYYQEKYNARFESQDYFLFLDEMFSEGHMYANEKIFKIKSLSELISLLKSLMKEYEVRHAYVWQSTFGNNWLLVDGHLTKTFTNPWEAFIGVYSVQSSVCSENFNVTRDFKEIKIYRSGDTLFLRKSTNSGSSSSRIQLGAYHVNIYLNEYGLISPSKVYMTKEMGGSWSVRTFLDRRISRLTLETFEDQTFKLIIENKFEDQDVTKPDTDSTCVLTGTFQK